VAKPGPPSRFAANKKHAFPQLVAGRRLLFAAKETNAGLEGPHGHASAKARNDPNSRVDERNCQRSRPKCGIQEA
jgi:hypothetical protein